MSKNKKKQKKGDSQIQDQLQSQKRDILQYQTTISKLSDIISTIKLDNQRIQQQSQSNFNNYQKQIQNLEITNKALEDYLSQTYKKKNQIQITNHNYERKIEKLEKKIEEISKEKDLLIQDLEKKVVSQNAKYEAFYNQNIVATNDYKRLQAENKAMKLIIDKQQQQMVKIVADMERDKIQSMDKLKKQMIEKTKKTEENLLVIRRNQMQTHTRLAILQNNQLTSQLEYQSKNTEKILENNIELQKKVKQLQRQLEIEKQVQNQLILRLNVCKNIMNNLKSKNQQYQQQEISKQKQHQKLLKEVRKMQRQQVQNMLGEEKKKLTQQLISYRTKYEDIYRQYTIKNEQAIHLQQKIQYYENQANNIFSLMLKYYKEILEGSIAIDQGNYIYDLVSLKKTNIEQWPLQSVSMTVKILLNLIKNHLNMKNLQIPTIKSVLHVNDVKTCNENMDKTKLFKNIQKNISRSASTSVAGGYTLPKIDTPSAYNFEDDNLKKNRNLSSIGSRVLKSFSINTKKPENGTGCVSAKIVQSNFRKWGKVVKENEQISIGGTLKKKKIKKQTN